VSAPLVTESPSATEVICVRGARVHNLQNIDVDIPRDQLVVVTGVSGSGKSSLAFDTLFAEGQRQYIDSLSVFARRFLDQLERPDVDLIEGLQPTICIDQHARSTNPRSTVATTTEIYDHLRLLYARAGQAVCYQCGRSIDQQAPEQVQERLLQLPEGTKLMLLAPLVRGRKGGHRDTLERIRKAGFVRCRIDGEVFLLEDAPQIDARKTHDLEAVVDRVIVRESSSARLVESIGLALDHGEGVLIASILSNDDDDQPQWRDELFSTLYACPHCKISFEPLEPRTFSFNSPHGACPECEGLGERIQFDLDLVIPDPERTLEGGAVAPWRKLSPSARSERLAPVEGLFGRARADVAAPFSELSEKQRGRVFHGDPSSPGLLTLLEKDLATATKKKYREWLETFRGPVTCLACGGARLRPEARACTFGGKAIHDFTALTVTAAKAFLTSVSVPPDEAHITEPVITEIEARLDFLERVGVQYLTLDRSAATLSGGEAQRVRLAMSIGSALVGVCYILDEPTIGLHPRDNRRLIGALRQLHEQGNSVIVVEHDEAMIRQADYLLDLGPGAGHRGGRVTAFGTPEEVERNVESLTGRYLSGAEEIPVPTERRSIDKNRMLRIEGATAHNLKNVSLEIPLGTLVCVTGVSGSGKSSLITQTLARALRRKLHGAGLKPGPYTSLRGAAHLSRLIEVDQSAIGRTPRSSPATYTGLFDEIRKAFASTREAKQRGFKMGRFSFNSKGGRCEACKGHGLKKVEMNFLPDLYVTCSECEGKRFNLQTLEVHYRGLTIADVLDLQIEEAREFFENIPAAARVLQALVDVGLGYMALGQPATTLSGGEAQRIKLAAELSRTVGSDTLYVLDEPTTGLHVDDVRQLLSVLGRLADQGNTVLVIEHHLDVIKSADWIVDMGPEGGEQGGHVLACGRPEEIAALSDNHTGRFLSEVL